MKVRLMAAMAAVAALTFACKKEDPIEPAPTTEKPIEVATAYPWLKTGHRWVYDFVYSGRVQDSLVTEVVGMQDGDYELRSVDMMLDQSTYQYMDKDGNLWSFVKGNPREKASMTMKYNAQAGDTWKGFNGMDSVDITVKSLNSSVTVPAGTFECTELEHVSRRNGNKSTLYVRKDLYLVKMVMNFGSQSASYELRKKNY